MDGHPRQTPVRTMHHIEVLFQHASVCAELDIDIHLMIRCRVVCVFWRSAVEEALPLRAYLDLRPYRANVTGDDVLRALSWMRGGVLRGVNLGGCKRITAGDMARVVYFLDQECRGMRELDVTGCEPDAVLSAVAVRARSCFGTKTPAQLCSMVKTLNAEAGEDRCSLEHLLPHLRQPCIILDAKLDPGVDALAAEAEKGGEWVAALLLSTSFPGNCDRAPRKFYADRGSMGLFSLRRDYVIHAATARGDERMVSLCLSSGADINARNVSRDTPLLVACREGHVALALALMIERADTRVANQNGDTPLLAACESGSFELVEALLQAGANASAANEHGETPLLAACMSSNANLSKALLQAGANPSAATKHGDTPLLAACAAGNFQLCELLLKAGANVFSQRRDGATPWALAIVSENTQLMALISKQIHEEPLIMSSGDADLNRIALEYSQQAIIKSRLLAGQAPLKLKGEIGAMLVANAVKPALKEQLRHVRTFIDKHQALIGDASRWPVEHAFEQLVSQEPNAVLACLGWSDVHLDGCDRKIVEWRNKPMTPRTCLLTMQEEVRVMHIAYSRCGRQLACVSEGWPSTVVVRDAVTGFVQPARCLHSSPHGSITADGRHGVRVHFSDVSNGKAMSSDGMRLVEAHRDSYGRTSEIRLLDAETGASIRTLTGHVNLVNAVCFSPDCKHIASGSVDNTVKLWEASTGSCLSTLAVDGQVECVRWAPNGNVIAVGFRRWFQLFDAQTRAYLGPPQLVEGHVASLAFSPCSSKIAVGFNMHDRYGRFQAGGVKIFGAHKTEYMCELSHERYQFKCSNCSTLAVGQYVLSTKDDLVLIHHLTRSANGTPAEESESKRPVAFFRAPECVQSLECTGDGIAVGCYSGEVLHLQAPWLQP